MRPNVPEASVRLFARTLVKLKVRHPLGNIVDRAFHKLASKEKSYCKWKKNCTKISEIAGLLSEHKHRAADGSSFWKDSFFCGPYVT